jgi:hypothetical protein
MEDSPEDLPKPPRQTAARPFFSPRPSSGEGVTGPLELSRRRAAQLFTPPSSPPASPLADKAPTVADSAETDVVEIESSNAADGSTEIEAGAADPDIEKEPDFEGDWTPAPLLMPEQTLDAASLLASAHDEDDDRLTIEQFEHEEIELTASASSVPHEHAIEVIGYDDANSLLKAASDEGVNPMIDGLRLESTEFSFEQVGQPPRLNVDSFWANEPFSAADASAPPIEAASVVDDAESMIDEETAGEGEHDLAIERFVTEPPLDAQPLEWADDPSTTISHAQAALEPEPEHDPAPAQAAATAPQEASMLADIAPPWMSRLTPSSTQALEELKESEPWDLTPARGLELIPEYEPEPVMEPVMEPVVAAPAGHDVADALERIAARVRDGGIDVPTGHDLSDEAALSAVLTALLRSRR